MTLNIPATTWQDPNRQVEYSTGDVNDIVDPDGNFLVDPSTNQIIDTGVTADYMAATTWETNDSE